MSHEQAASKALELLKPLTISEETDEEDVDEPPVVESDAAFETRLAAFLDDDCPTLADAAGDLGRLGCGAENVPRTPRQGRRSTSRSSLGSD